MVIQPRAGSIPTEVGQLINLQQLSLRSNQLTGAIWRGTDQHVVYESTIDGFVPENALAGTIPTEIGQLVQLKQLTLGFNQLTGACLQTIELIDGKRVYH